MKTPASTIILLLSVYASSAHIMPHAAVHHTRTPHSAVRAFAEADSEVVPAPPARPSGVATLTSVTELERALEEAQECGRLCVIKFYAPYCSACLAVKSKFQRAAKNNPEHNFYEVDFSRSKPLCKHCGITALPTGLIFRDGNVVVRQSLRSMEFRNFMSALAEQTQALASAPTAPMTDADEPGDLYYAADLILTRLTQPPPARDSRPPDQGRVTVSDPCP